jgi:eukaryotic translation initiation factor 2C
MEHMNYKEIRNLTPPGGFPERDRIKLQRFLSGLRVVTVHTGGDNARVVKRVSAQGAQNLTFKARDGPSMTVAVCDTFALPGLST